VEYREAELHEAVPTDDQARFLHELRQLRNGAGLEYAELAARAHYPCDAILAAEAGPALPDLPVLSAYVLGCGGTVTEWEERWRTLTRSPVLTLLPTREAGCSDAAAAGARIGSVSLAADAHDPAIIMAALGRVANGIAAEPSPSSFFTPASAPPIPGRASTPSSGSPASVPDADAALDADAAPAVASVPDADSMSAGHSMPDADAVSSPVTPDPATVAGRTAAPGWARPVVQPVSAAGRAPYTRRPMPSKSLLAAIAILVCLAATIWALFS
jgi:hypothetical protein